MNQASLMSSMLAMGLLWGGVSVATGERSLTDAEYERRLLHLDATRQESR